MAIRYDSFKIGKFRRTPSGGIVIQAVLARTGVLEYHTSAGTVREYRDPSEVFSETSMQSVAHAPVTDLHPNEFVTPSTYSETAKGYIGESVEKSDTHITGHVIVTDAEMIRMIESGQRKEISPGYVVQIDPTPGETPEGERYDQRQINISHNHFALLPKGAGRSGAQVALRLDSNGNETRQTEKELMKQEVKIDGVVYEFEAENTALKQIIDKGQVEKEKGLGRTDALEEELKKTKEELAKAQDPKAISARIDARLKLEKRAKELNKEIKCDGLSDQEVMIRALGKDFDPTGKSEERILGHFEGAKPRNDSVADARVAAEDTQRQDTTSKVDEMQEQHRVDCENRWQKRMERGL